MSYTIGVEYINIQAAWSKKIQQSQSYIEEYTSRSNTLNTFIDKRTLGVDTAIKSHIETYSSRGKLQCILRGIFTHQLFIHSASFLFAALLLARQTPVSALDNHRTSFHCLPSFLQVLPAAILLLTEQNLVSIFAC